MNVFAWQLVIIALLNMSAQVYSYKESALALKLELNVLEVAIQDK